MNNYQYAHPAVTVDRVVFGLADDELNILLIQRDLEPYQDAWALPGGFVEMDEDLNTAARRELQGETGVREDAQPIVLESLPGEFTLRTAQLYRFDRERYEAFRREEFEWVV